MSRDTHQHQTTQNLIVFLHYLYSFLTETVYQRTLKSEDIINLVYLQPYLRQLLLLGKKERKQKKKINKNQSGTEYPNKQIFNVHFAHVKHRPHTHKKINSL